MKTSEALGLIFGGLGVSLAVVSFVKAQSCQPPAGGCPSGETYDYKSCQCTSSGGGSTYDVSFLVEGPNGPIGGAVGLLGATPAYSDSSGNMIFSSVAAGSYLFTCSASGYIDVSEQVGVSASQTSFTVDMKLCAPPPGGCGCGAVFSPSACTCVPQGPASIDIVSSIPFQQNWAIETDYILKKLQAGLTDNPCPQVTCGGVLNPPIPPPPIQYNALAIPIIGKVLDAGGNNGKPAPVCGVQVMASLGALQSAQWTVSGSGNTWSGYFSYALDKTSVTTDSNGEFTFTLTIVIHVTSPIPGGCFPCSCLVTAAQDFPVALYTTVSPAIKNVTSISMSSTLCAYGVV